MFAPSIAFVDLETTGTSAGADRVTEVGIVRVDQGAPVSEWSSLVDPERSIPAGVQAHRLRRRDDVIALSVAAEPAPPDYVKSASIDPASLEHLYGPFSTRRATGCVTSRPTSACAGAR